MPIDRPLRARTGVSPSLLVSLLLLLSSIRPVWASAGNPATAGVVNINTATIQQLQLLPRIGPAMARRIVARRDKRPYRRAYELLRVRGIGRKTFRRIRPHVTVKGPTTLTKKLPRQSAP